MTTPNRTTPPQIAILTESADAAEIMGHATRMLGEFGLGCCEEQIASRDALAAMLMRCETAGAKVFIVADSNPIALSAVVSGLTLKPVLAVPMESTGFPALSALQATTSAPGAVASLAIGKAGAINSALLAIAILANSSAELAQKLRDFRTQQTAKVLADVLE